MKTLFSFVRLIFLALAMANFLLFADTIAEIILAGAVLLIGLLLGGLPGALRRRELSRFVRYAAALHGESPVRPSAPITGRAEELRQAIRCLAQASLNTDAVRSGNRRHGPERQVLFMEDGGGQAPAPDRVATRPARKD